MTLAPYWEKKRKLVEELYGRSFPSLTCVYCIEHALDDDYGGQISDDEELDQLHKERRRKIKDRRLKERMLYYRSK